MQDEYEGSWDDIMVFDLTDTKFDPDECMQRSRIDNCMISCEHRFDYENLIDTDNSFECRGFDESYYKSCGVNLSHPWTNINDYMECGEWGDFDFTREIRAV